jgi:L-asparaginase / beta-aspartyl-peptidase
VQYKNYGVQQAADEVVQNRLTALKGTGGVIVISPKGDVAWSFNTPGMYRASTGAGLPARIAIFKDER